MMLLFKNFPQDEPIIIIIFDNRQIELHYHTIRIVCTVSLADARRAHNSTAFGVNEISVCVSGL